MRAHRTLVLSLSIGLILAVPAAAGAKQLQIGGSTSILPLAEKLAAAYHRAFPRIPKPKVRGGQSDVGITGATSGEFDIGTSSRDLKPRTDPPGLVFYKIAKDGICVITNRENPIVNMSEETVKAIFTGAVTNWSQVPGSKVNGHIELIQRDGSSGTQDAFKHIFLGENVVISPTAKEETSNGLVQLNVEKKPDAVGFVSFAYRSGVNVVQYEGVACNQRNARAKLYLGVRNFWFVTKGKAKGEALKFIAWVVKKENRVVEKIINQEWISIH